MFVALLRLRILARAKRGHERLLEAWGLWIVLVEGLILRQRRALVLQVNIDLDFLVILKSGQFLMI